MNFTESLTTHIDKLVGTLKEEDELKEVIKKKFTKKEFKVFVSKEEGKKDEEIASLINDTQKRVCELYKSACKKLNQERIKQELVNL